MKKILITGATSGIGEERARRFHSEGKKIIIDGRSEERLKDIISKCPGMSYVLLDMRNQLDIENVSQFLMTQHGDLDTLINNAGIQKKISFETSKPLSQELLSEEIQTNFLGCVLLTSALLPLLKRQERAQIVNISSGLALVPLASAPLYCASKAALHSFTMSLRHQLRHTNIQVTELLPPLVQTNLHRGQNTPLPHAMPLAEFIESAMKELKKGEDEILIGPVKSLRRAARFLPKRIFKIMNSRV